MKNKKLQNVFMSMTISLACGAMLGACGGGSQSASNSQTSLLANGEACKATWSSTAIYTQGMSASYSGVNYTAAYWTQNNNPSTSNGGAGSGQPWVKGFTCSSGATTTSVATTTSTSKAGSTTTTTIKVTTTTKGSTTTTGNTTTTTISGGSSGVINFHLLLGAGAAQDQLVLNGDKYTDLIMSNMVAGVMYGHLIQEYYPGMKFNKDYLYGSVFAQLLQENLATQYYSGSTLIDPSPDQQAVMGTGQGGPYQINNYSADMVSGSYTPGGHSLINYVAIQKNIGFTMATAPTQYSRPTPPSFNNKYYGPMLTAYFHYNDFIALIVTGKGTGGWVTPWQPYYDNALVNFTTLPNNFLDMVLNVAYNQGAYGTLMTSYSKLGATATASTITSINAYSSVWGATDTYKQYPYQIHYYLDQLYDNPIPTTNATTFTTPQNHVVFGMQSLATVFSNVFQTMAYVNGTGQSAYISSAQANAAFTAGLSQAGVASNASLDLSNAANRAKIFSILENAIGSLETTLNTKFNATTNVQL